MAWEKGLVRYPWGRAPIEQMLVAERLEAKARAAQQAAEDAAAQRQRDQQVADMAHNESVAALSQELQSMKLMRQSSQACLALALKSVPLFSAFVDDLTSRQRKGEKMPVRDVLLLGRVIASMSSLGGEVAHRAQEMRRKAEERPDVLVQVEGSINGNAVAPAEVAEEIEAAARMLTLAKQLGVNVKDTTPRVIDAEVVQQGATPAPVAQLVPAAPAQGSPP